MNQDFLKIASKSRFFRKSTRTHRGVIFTNAPTACAKLTRAPGKGLGTSQNYPMDSDKAFRRRLAEYQQGLEALTT